jgi:large subunit ribosomal protein L18
LVWGLRGPRGPSGTGCELQGLIFTLEALVQQRNDQVVVPACTCEWATKKHLYSTKKRGGLEEYRESVAHRCLEAGVNFMVYQPTPWEAASDSMRHIQSAMTEGGVVLAAGASEDL